MCVALKNATRIIYCYSWLHNFCINEGDFAPEIKPGDPEELTAEYYIAHGRSMRGQSRIRQLVLDKWAFHQFLENLSTVKLSRISYRIFYRHSKSIQATIVTYSSYNIDD